MTSLKNSPLHTRPRFKPKPAFVLAAVLVLLTLFVYWPLPTHDFINFDDDAYVTMNPMVISGLSMDGLKWAFTTRFHGHWHPLTWLSHMTDVTVFGTNPAGHHAVNLLIHLLNVLLVFFVLCRATGTAYRSFLVAALFACHPMNVEPAAWIAGRKDLLSTLFFLAAVFSYIRYAEKPAAGRYAILLLCFILSLMAKPMAITLPVVLLLLDFWPLSRFKSGIQRKEAAYTPRFHQAPVSRLVFEKLLLMLPVCLSALMAVWAITRSDLSRVNFARFLPGIHSTLDASVAYARYLGKLFWPKGLAVYYTFPESAPLAFSLAAVAGICLTTALSMVVVKKRPYLCVGWLWFLVTLIPVIGFFQLGPIVMADRYAYLPFIGLFTLVVWGAADLCEKLRLKPAATAAVATAVILLLLGLSGRQLAHWKNSLSLFTHTVSVTQNNFKALNNLGVAYGHREDYDTAVRYLRRALQLKPGNAKANFNLGLALARTGDLDAAADHFLRALKAKQDYAKAHDQLGDVYARQEKYTDAIAHYRATVRLEPRYALGFKKLGILYMTLEKWEDARQALQQAHRLHGSDADVLYRLGVLSAMSGNGDAAVSYLSKSIEIQPGFTDARYQLGMILLAQKRFKQALPHFSRVLKSDPGHAGARRALGRAALQMNQGAKASD